jgi:carbohydrate kinase (thermoresistant glucokinase family)
MGVAGAGKSTVGKALAVRLGWVFLEGDTLHPAANVAKMESGQPLGDDDRWPWLAAIADWIEARADADEAAVVACSALKRAYREILTRGRPFVRTVYLQGSPDLIGERVSRRKGHYFPPSLVASQFVALEVPAADEHAIVVDIGPPVEVQVERIIQALCE